MNTLEKTPNKSKKISANLFTALKNRAGNLFDCLHQNFLLIFAGAMVSVIAAVALAWVALQAKHDQIGHLIARGF